MNAQTDQQLLQAYAASRSEAAFAELVHRHIDLVYSAALRMVCDSHQAEDVTQGVFVALAQNARQLTQHPVLSGWLHRTTQNLAANAVRTNVRRQTREQEAAAMNELLSAGSDVSWEQIAPHLDAALGELSEPDRDAVLLRYFEKKSAQEMAERLGISDEAAQKRVSRAVERLREFFAKRGVTVGASGLVIVISANAVQAAPVGLAVTISAAALAGTLTATTLATKTALMTMNWINAKSIAAIAASALVAGTGTYLVQQQEANRLRNENQSFAALQQQLTGERDAALTVSTANIDELERLRREKGELLRLRGEVGTLRTQARELEKLREHNRQLQTSLAKVSQAAQHSETDPEADLQRQVVIAKLNDAKLLVLGLHMYASDNQNRLPADINQASNYWANAGHRLTETNQFELVIQGSLTSITNPSTVIAVREKEASLVNGKWVKAYGFADGHSEYKREPPEGFDAWEKQHMIVPPGSP
jgi:RNA polymerase sigma factor (sigma-70 family)